MSFGKLSVDFGRSIGLFVLFSSVAALASQQPKAFVNDICLPSNLYMLSDTQNDIFVKPFIKRWRPYNDYVRFDAAKGSTQKFMRRLSHVASIDKPVDGAVLSVDLVNGDEFETVKNIKTKIRVGKKAVGDKDVYVQIVGDSVTHGRFFQHALLETNYVPNVHLVGLLKCGENQYNEGRGGWTLYWYFQPPTKECWSYHGFMQPAEGRYWGARGFWKMAWRCVRGKETEFAPVYCCSRYDDVVDRFDEKTGVLLNPREGDIQFDNDTEKFVRYDGKEWKVQEKDDLTWSFDYGKYLEMWNLKKPEFLFLSLGPNDFRNHINADFSRWIGWVETFRKSYLKACPDGHFVVCIPICNFGSIDNTKGEFTPKLHAAMWRFRDWLIKNYDNREDERLYLLDSSLAVDEDYGFNVEDGAAAVPFATYKGKERLNVDTGNVHPYANYPSMGIPFAAFIQYHRKGK